MAGSSLAHILDPPRPSADATLPATPAYSQSPHPSVSGTGTSIGTPNSAAQALRATPIPVIQHSSVPYPPGSAPISAPTTPSSRGHTGASLYACGDCGRRYSRPEHLQRHVQTHTLGRRFSCSICGKSFARADLKKRHEANHDNDANKKRRRTDTSPGAGRVAHACKACAAARVKCQEDKPCQRCVKRGLTCLSSEAGSTAAMHLMHLSASAHATSHSSPDGHEDASPTTSYDQSDFPTIAPLAVRPDVEQDSPASRTSPSKAEEGQLPTPDTVVDQGQSLFSINKLSRLPLPKKVDAIVARLSFRGQLGFVSSIQG